MLSTAMCQSFIGLAGLIKAFYSNTAMYWIKLTNFNHQFIDLLEGFPSSKKYIEMSQIYELNNKQ